MRALFLVLILVNLALFGWLRGMFGAFPAGGHEPGRLDQQIAADRVRVLTDSEERELQRRAAERGAPAGPPAPQVPPAAGEDAPLVCLQMGEFTSQEQLTRLHDRLTGLKLADRASDISQDVPGWYRVYLPPATTLADAEARMAQLHEQGVHDALVLKDEGPLRLAILLGSFRDRDLARRQLAMLGRRGVKGARISERPTTQRSTLVELRGLDASMTQQLQELQKDFPQQKLQPCPVPAATP